MSLGGRTLDHTPIDDHLLVDGTGKVIFLGTAHQCRARKKEAGRFDLAYARGCRIRPVRSTK